MNKTTKTMIATTLVVGSLFTGSISIPAIYAEKEPERVHVVNDVKHEQLIKKIMYLSSKGKTINSEEFGIGSHEVDIRKKWGEPTSSNEYFLSYAEKKQTEFAIENGYVKNWVNSSDKRLEEITYEEVLKTAGKPLTNKTNEGRRFVTYQTGKYNLLLIFDGYKKTDTITWLFVRSEK
ncbi:DUF4309 domain-containing protein [Shimazuella kribbensis]|uniref:DUF4309 domain-containing protein n=1 Tax=Shimazuella kribbensis TaxID=139808 RepID=UPI00041DC71D|nr:DUF4309 domain-containing protein [Shimazuella kribbensis]